MTSTTALCTCDHPLVDHHFRGYRQATPQGQAGHGRCAVGGCPRTAFASVQPEIAAS